MELTLGNMTFARFSDTFSTPFKYINFLPDKFEFARGFHYI